MEQEARTEPILVASQVSKQFPGVRALDNVDIDLVPGEVHALVGENGAGKSTLIKIFGGLLKPTAGRVLLNGEVVHFDNPHAIAGRRHQRHHARIQSGAPAHCGGKHLPGTGAPTSERASRLAHDPGAHVTSAGRAGPPRVGQPARGISGRRRPANGGDCQGPVARVPHHHPRRAHGGPECGRGGAIIRHYSSVCAGVASPCCTSLTASTRSSASPIESPSCATASASGPGPSRRSAKTTSST